MAMQGSSRLAVESGDVSSKFDDDGKKKRTGIYLYLFYSFNTYNSQHFIHRNTPNIFLEFHFLFGMVLNLLKEL